MADKTVIAATLQVDTGSSNANIKEVNQNLNEVRSSLDKTGATATGTGKTIEGAGGSFGKLKSQLSAMPGPLGQAGEGVGKLSSAFKALLANPVGLIILAIVAALALLYKSFTNSFEGAQKMEQVFAGIKAVAQSLIDNITKIAGAIIKLMKFDFSGAIADIKGVVKEAGAAYTAMANLTKQAQAIHQEELANDLDQAKRQAKLADLREKANDDSIPAAQRKKAAQDLLKESQENAKADLKLAADKAANKIAMLTLEKDGARKNQDEINKINIDQINNARENSNELRSIGKLVSKADKEIAAEGKARHDAAIARSKEALAAAKELAKQRQDESDKEVEDARKRMKIDIDNAEAKIKNQEEENKRLALIKPPREIDTNLILAKNAVLANDIIKQSEQEKTDFVLALAEKEAAGKKAMLGAVSGALGTLSDIVGKQSAAGKILAIAQTTIDTYQAGFAAFKGMVTTIPGPVGIALGVVAAAGALASGIAAVKKIIAVKLPGASGGGAAPTGLQLPAAPVAPVRSSTTLDQDSLNGIGNAASGARVYVLDQDVANNRERNERLNRAARLG